MISIFIRLIVIILFLFALGSRPEAYYFMLRFVIFLISLHTIYLAKILNKKYWIIIFVLIAIAYNPIKHIEFGRPTWLGLDLLVITALAVSLFKVKKLNKK